MRRQILILDLLGFRIAINKLSSRAVYFVFVSVLSVGHVIMSVDHAILIVDVALQS